MVRSSRSYPGGAATPWYLAGGAPAPLAVYQPIGAASLAASYVNLVSASYTLLPRMSPPLLTADGWEFQNDALETAFSFLPSWAIIYRGIHKYSTANMYQTAVARGGMWTDNSNFALTVRSTTQRPANVWVRTTTLYGLAANKNTVADLPIVHAAAWVAGSNQMYIDGAEVDTNTHPQGGDGGQPLTIGGPNTLISTGINWTGSIAAIAIYPSSTDHAVWVPAVSAAMAAL